MLLHRLALACLGALPLADKILRGECGHKGLSPNGYETSIQEKPHPRKVKSIANRLIPQPIVSLGDYQKRLNFLRLAEIKSRDQLGLCYLFSCAQQLIAYCRQIKRVAFGFSCFSSSFSLSATDGSRPCYYQTRENLKHLFSFI